MSDELTELRQSLEQAREALRQAQIHNEQLSAEVDQMRTLADATAHERDQTHIRRLMRALTLLSDVNQAIVRIRDLRTLYQRICDLSVEKGGYVLCWIGLLSSDGQQLQPIASRGLPAPMLADFYTTLRKATAPSIPVFEAIRTGNPVIMADVEHEPDIPPAVRAMLSNAGALSAAVFPLIVKGIARGTFTLASGVIDAFNSDEIRLLDEMAGDIAYALEFTEQEAQQQRDARRLEVLHAIDLGLLHGDSIPSLIAVTIKHLRQLIPCQQIRVTVFNESLTIGTIFASESDTPTDLLVGEDKPISPLFVESLGSNTTSYIEDLLARPEIHSATPYALRDGMRAIFNALLIAQGRKLGTLQLNAAAPAFFTPDYQTIAVEVASQLAIAIQQMQLSQKLERYTADLELRVRERTSQLEQSKERLEAILNNSVDAILLIERDFTIRQTNHTFQHMFACTDADYLRRPMSVLLHESTPLPDVETIRLHDAGSPPFRLEARAVRCDQTEFDAELILTAIQEDGFVCSIRDVTDRKRAENALKQTLAQERELGELKTRFVSMASHEFRTPLAGILASSETLLYYRGKMQESDIERRLQNIQRQVKHMTAIMEDVLQLGRMQSGQSEFQPADTDLNALCHEVIADWGRQPEHADRIQYRGPGTPLIIPVDARLIRQSMDNLISNALKYSPAEKPVRVTLSDNLDSITFQVSDEGIGIPEPDIPKLFEPFHRASNASSVSGTGLGLSITKQAIEQHGGTLLVESVVNVGTTFTVRLPIKSADDSTIHERPKEN